jgi:hypothetical protein
MMTPTMSKYTKPVIQNPRCKAKQVFYRLDGMFVREGYLQCELTKGHPDSHVTTTLDNRTRVFPAR